MRHIKSMHLAFGYFVLYSPIYRLTELKKKRFHAQHCPCYVLGVLVHDKVVVDFGRKVFSVDGLI